MQQTLQLDGRNQRRMRSCTLSSSMTISPLVAVESGEMLPAFHTACQGMLAAIGMTVTVRHTSLCPAFQLQSQCLSLRPNAKTVPFLAAPRSTPPSPPAVAGTEQKIRPRQSPRPSSTCSTRQSIQWTRYSNRLQQPNNPSRLHLHLHRLLYGSTTVSAAISTTAAALWLFLLRREALLVRYRQERLRVII